MSQKYAAAGCVDGYFVDTASFQVPRGRITLFYGFAKNDVPDRTMSSHIVAVGDSIAELRIRKPEAFRPMDQALQHDFDTLVTIERDGPSQVGLQAASVIRRELAADTLAPDWLRDYAGEVVEAMRER